MESLAVENRMQKHLGSAREEMPGGCPGGGAGLLRHGVQRQLLEPREVATRLCNITNIFLILCVPRHSYFFTRECQQNIKFY